MGINDFGGVSPITYDYINPEKPWPQIELLKKVCLEKNHLLLERLPIYEKYINNSEFCSEILKLKIDNVISNV